MTRILHVATGFFPMRGGIEQVAEDIVHSLSDNKDIVQKVICFNGNGEAEGTVTRMKETVHDTIRGAEIVRCGCITKIFSQSISLTLRRELGKLIREFKPDIIIMHYPNPFFAFMLLPFLKKNRDIKFILWWHLDIVRQKILGKLFHFQNIKLCERADVIVPTSENYIKGSKYLTQFKDKCTVIPNCVQNSRIPETHETTQMASEIRKKYPGKFISFSVGRNVPYKGFRYLIKAAEYLDDDFIVLIAGAGTQTEEMQELVKDNPRVKLLGMLSNKELTAHYIACDVYSFPSVARNEAFGIALAEGMYFGKPAVTFTIPGSGVNYVSLDGVTGIECPNGDVKAFAEALMKLRNDPELRRRLGENAMQRVLENFMYYKFRQRVIQLISSMA